MLFGKEDHLVFTNGSKKIFGGGMNLIRQLASKHLRIVFFTI
jgi:hypothetical protein